MLKASQVSPKKPQSRSRILEKELKEYMAKAESRMSKRLTNMSIGVRGPE